MSTPVSLLLGLTAVTWAIKTAGPVALGGRTLPPWCNDVITLLAPALLAALVATSIFADGKHLAVGEQTAGVAAAALVTLRTNSVVLSVFTAAAVTALLRAL